jgi:hypothetical protein
MGGAGRNGNYLVPLDVDVDDVNIVAAVARSVPKASVAKAGAHGFTCLYRSSVPITAVKFRPAGTPKPIVEILTSGQSVIPPTVHPDTGRPYQWLTPRTLLDMRLEDLVPIDPEHVDALAKALEPWCPPRTYQPAPAIERELVDDRRMLAYARACIRSVATRLASLSDGRHNALFCAAAGLGRYVRHAIIGESELRSALITACQANGLSSKRGFRECDACITRGLEYSRNDPLPDLDCMPGARPRRPSKWDAYEAMAAR